jgi:hypothetical protein
VRTVLPVLLVLAAPATAAPDLRKLFLLEPDLDALTRDAPRCDPARAHCVGLALHVAIDDRGSVASAAWIAAQLAAANHHFAALDVGFEIVRAVPLAASAVRVEDRRERSALGATIDGPVVDVFFIEQLDDIDIAGAFAYGVTWPGKGGKKFVIVSTRAWGRTLAHELGHVFGLPHSTHPISIMNKTERAEPPQEKRTFADEELAAMRPVLKRHLRSGALANRATARQ